MNVRDQLIAQIETDETSALSIGENDGRKSIILSLRSITSVIRRLSVCLCLQKFSMKRRRSILQTNKLTISPQTEVDRSNCIAIRFDFGTSVDELLVIKILHALHAREILPNESLKTLHGQHKNKIHSIHGYSTISCIPRRIQSSTSAIVEERSNSTAIQSARNYFSITVLEINHSKEYEIFNVRKRISFP